MHPWARAALQMAVGFWVAVVLFETVAIYGFGQFEHAWGRGPSLQVVSWVATGVALVVLVSAALGFKVGSQRGTVPRAIIAASLGFLLVLLLSLILWVLSRIPSKVGLLNAATALGLVAVTTTTLAYCTARVKANAV
jgi:hypothetical protein